jgi:hypothetical protein
VIGTQLELHEMRTIWFDGHWMLGGWPVLGRTSRLKLHETDCPQRFVALHVIT